MFSTLFLVFFYVLTDFLSVDIVSRTKLAHVGSCRWSVVIPEDLKGVKLVDLASTLILSFGLPSDHGLIT